MARPAGGWISGYTAPTASAARGVWSLRDVYQSQRANSWPRSFPGSVAGIVAWYDAADATTLFDATTGGSVVVADGAIARWEDKSGNGNHLTQATGTKQPIRKTSVQNSLDIVRFDGSNDQMTRSSLAFSSVTAASLVMVLKFRSTTSFRIAGGFGTALSYGALTIEKNRGSSRFSFTVGSYSLTTEASFGATSPNTNFNSLANIYGSSTATSFINNTQDATVSFAGPLTGTSGLSIGGYFDTSPYWADIDVAEICYYTKALSSTERSSLQSYFAAKWGI